MSYLKRQELILVLSTLIVTSCTTGLDAGSIEKTFTGIKSTKVTGPESVQVNWDTNSGCEGYGVYRLGSDSDSNKIADATVPPYTVKSPFVESERSYTFAVGCNKGGKVQGLSVMQNAVTWPKFNGTLISSIDASGQKPVVVLKWSYAPSPEVIFDLYVKPSPLPTSISTWTLNRVGGAGSAYSDTKMCSVMGNQVRLGEGSCPALEGGQGYMFKVVAHYPDGSYSTDLAGVGAYIDVPPPFTAPDCILTSAGIGADATTSSLFLRCNDQALTISCPAGTITTHAYQGVNGTRISVSDTLTGSGTLRIQPQLSTGQLNDRSVENLEIEYVCTGPGLTQKSAVRYDGNPVTRPDGTSYTPIKPVLKFNSGDFVRAPNESKSEIPSYYGKALAVGDFNCDGKPDLAVGLPDVTYNQAPYFSKNPGSGAVIVYYDYVQNADGSVSSTDTQYLSFSDLTSYARFGASLSAGNINRDYVLRPDGNTYACDDLIVGAPGDINSNNAYLGEAYIFYGHPQKFSQPLNLATLTVNDSSCHGSIDATVCDPVRLYQDMQTDYKIALSENISGPRSGVPKNTFGFSVSYIRDFNADGYGDIAIGDPYCHWDGEVRNGFGDEPGGGNRIYNVGCVYVYWGGPNGIQRVDVGPEPGTANRIVAPFVKIFPPIPQPGMHFGWSIGGGGDIDGRLPVPLVNNAGNVILAEGNDFIVGAPDFNYSNTTTAIGSINNSMAWTVYDGGGNEWRDPLVTINESQAFEFNSDPNASTKITPPLNGAWTTPSAWTGSPMPLPTNPKLLASTGIAFAYLGRSSMAEYTLSPKSGSYYRMPDAVTDPEDPLTNTPGAPTILNLISGNTQSRQNGSKGFTLATTGLTGLQPNDSFYNCGTRGASGAPKISGSDAGRHKHISCLAGRNNVSWIFPQVTTADNPVIGFGSNVTIAGSKEQNPVALLEIGNARIQSTAANTYQRQLADGSKFVGYAQGNIHERLTGDSLWELGYRGGTMDDGQSPLPCEHMSGAIGDMATATYDNSAQTCQSVRPVRSAVRESYANIRGLSSVPDGNIQADVNRDGYADVLVAARTGELYTFFGNYAADFAYAYNLANTGGSGVTVPYSTTSNCLVNNYANGLTATIVEDKAPFSTHTWSHALSTGSVNYTWTSIHPVRPKAPAAGPALRLGFIGDTVASNQASSYAAISYTGNANILNAMKGCLPQRKKYLTAPSSIAAADLNDDHIVDGVIGYPAETSSTGMARAFIANSSGGGGLASEFVYNSGAPNWGKAGSAVAATNWRFIKSAPDSYEMTRRDLFVGAPYASRGNGAVLGYSGYNGAQIAGGSPVTLTFTVAVPSALNAEDSKIIGDINGDGFDDILMPVKRLDARGNIFFDAIIYFGSSFGPVTTPMCLDKQASITKSNGSVISSSDCNASISGQTALLGSIPIRLPQYFTRPSGMSWSWAMRIQPAGDINGDGRSDIYVIDYEAAKGNGDQGVIYALFGSDIGLSNGSPAMGPSTNKTPQIVTQNSWVISMANVRSPAGTSSAYTSSANSAPPGNGYAYTHGDFNGDGYEDVAWGMPWAYSFQNSNSWLCNPAIGSLTQMSFCGFKDTIGGVTYNVDAPAPGRLLPAVGAVLVMYGGPQGVQTPINGLGAAVDFDYDPYVTCDDFYHNCKKANPSNVVQYTDNRGPSGSYNNISPVNMSLYDYVRIAYGSISRSGNGFTINTTAADTDPDHRKPSCVPGTGSRAPDICLATLIPTPAFYNVDNSYASLQELYFGSSMTAADINGDGIDDLIVGQTRFYHTAGLSALNTTAAAPAEGRIVNAPTVADAGNHGAAFIYYGARGYGIVAPNAERYLGPQARGVDAVGSVQSNALVFQIYPSYDATHKPPLDSVETSRNFASNLSAGDFNGDGSDDVAIASGRGHVYVYYGPICQWDNSTSALGDPNYSMYYKPNATIDTTSAIPAASCQTILFNNPSDLNPLFTAVPSKRLAPQMISIAGLSGSEWMGTTLISMRKGKGNIKNSNSVTENQKASDLIIAGSNANDPNASTVSYKYTGLGYAFFGHTAGDSLFKTKGGLYVSNASYNSSITKVDVIESSVNVSYFYYSPIILRPHTTNSSVARFFYSAATAGDVNGDGRMDLLMPTNDLDTTQDGSSASFGGGFRLFY